MDRRQNLVRATDWQEWICGREGYGFTRVSVMAVKKKKCFHAIRSGLIHNELNVRHGG